MNEQASSQWSHFNSYIGKLMQIYDEQKARTKS